MPLLWLVEEERRERGAQAVMDDIQRGRAKYELGMKPGCVILKVVSMIRCHAV